MRFQRRDGRDPGASAGGRGEDSRGASNPEPRAEEDAPTEAKPDPRELADSLLAAFDGAAGDPAGIEHAIRRELLITALGDAAPPRDVSELLHVLQRIAVGEVANAFVLEVRRCAKAEPGLLLLDLARRRA